MLYSVMLAHLFGIVICNIKGGLTAGMQGVSMLLPLDACVSGVQCGSGLQSMLCYCPDRRMSLHAHYDHFLTSSWSEFSPCECAM